MLIDLFVLGASVVALFDLALWMVKQTNPNYQPKHERR